MWYQASQREWPRNVEYMYHAPKIKLGVWLGRCGIISADRHFYKCLHFRARNWYLDTCSLSLRPACMHSHALACAHALPPTPTLPPTRLYCRTLTLPQSHGCTPRWRTQDTLSQPLNMWVCAYEWYVSDFASTWEGTSNVPSRTFGMYNSTQERLLPLHFYPASACTAGVKQCLCVCVCVCPHKNIEKCFKQGRKGVYRCPSQWKTISIIILGCFCTWYKSRRFFTSLFQLLPIIGFVAPPLSKSHVVVTVSNATRTPIRAKIQAESIWQRTERRAG